MLDTRTYTRAELVEIFKTNRLDSIKDKLTRNGYEYVSSGRAERVTLTVTKKPSPFRDYCIKELGFAPQTHFHKLQPFLYRFAFGEDFRQLPMTEMARQMKDEISICDDTINSYIQQLIANDIVYRDESNFNYYVISTDRNGNKTTKRIDKETYSKANAIYWEEKAKGNKQAYLVASASIGGKPYKNGVILENAFGKKKFDELKKILKEEKENNGKSI